MKAVIYKKYGSPEVLRLDEAKFPNVGPDDVLVKIYATSVTAGDCRMRKAKPFLVRFINGLLSPTRFPILGMEFSGIIAEKGEKVNRFDVGDEVYGSTAFQFGAYAQFAAVNAENSIAIKPKNLSFEQAATLPIGAATAHHFLFEKAQLQPHQKVLIYGASGSVGTYAVQWAKSVNTNVHAVCGGHHQEKIKTVGADVVYNYSSPDFKLPHHQFDVIFDAVGFLSTRKAQQALKPKGKWVTVKKGLAKVTSPFLEELAQHVDNRSIIPLIDRSYLLHEIVQAHHYVDRGHKFGNVSIRVR